MVAQATQRLPPEALQALQRAGVPAAAMSVVVHDTSSGQRVLDWQERRPVNPASLTKLLTTQAALERLGFTVRAVPQSQGTPFANVLLIADLKGGAS